MGAKNIRKFIEENGYCFKNKMNLSSLNNKSDILSIKRIAIDISQLIHRYNSDYIISIIKVFNKFKYNNISPVFVFDGKPPTAKKRVLNKRKKEKQKTLDKIENFTKRLEEIKLNKNLISNNEYEEKKNSIETNIKKFKKRTFSIKKEHIQNLKEVFNLLQIPYIHLNYEADLICALLVKNKIVDACLSDDMDLLAFGCSIILRDYDLYKNTVSVIISNDICKKMEITQEQLTYLIIFNGCDYSYKLNNINMSYIHTLFKTGKSVKEIFDLVDNQDYNYKEAYDLFTQYIDITIKDIHFIELIDKKYRNINNTEKDLYFTTKTNENDTEFFKKSYLTFVNEYINHINTIMPVI
jgi:5'-3' exonuclease